MSIITYKIPDLAKHDEHFLHIEELIEAKRRILLEKQKTYYEENVEKIKSKCKVYRDKHKDKNAEYK